MVQIFYLIVLNLQHNKVKKLNKKESDSYELRRKL